MAAAPLGDGRPQLWALGDARLWSTWYASTSWLDWRYWQSAWCPQPPPFSATALASTPLSDGRLQLWAIDQAGMVWSCWKNTIAPTSSWSGWSQAWLPGGQTFGATAVAATQLSDGRVQVWAVSKQGIVWSCWKTTTDSGSAWTPWASAWAQPGQPFVARAVPGCLAAAPLSDQRVQLWAVDRGSGALWSCWKTQMDSSSAWSPWTTDWSAAPGYAAQAVTAAPLSDGRLQLWALDGSGQLSSCWKSGGADSGWTPWTAAWLPHPAGFATRAMVAAIADNITTLWAVDGGGRMWTASKVSTFAGDSWTPWALQLPMERQEQDNWCWSACATATAHQYDAAAAWTQCSLAAHALGKDCCANPGSCNQGWYLAQALQIVGHLADSRNGTVPEATIASEIAGGRPLGVRQAWDGGGAHFIMVSGGSDWVVVHDPWYGRSYVPYATLVRGYKGSGTWTNTYLTR